MFEVKSEVKEENVDINKGKVYIIILNYNGWADTIECLESVLRNDYPNYQVIVVDNNSPNNSMDYIKAWAEGKIDVWVDPKNPLRRLSFPPVPKPIPYVYYTKEEAEKGGNKDLEKDLSERIATGITTKHPLIFIQTGENLGFSHGNNVAIRFALVRDDFDSVILLNNDTVIEKDLIRKTMEAKFNFGEKAIYGARILYYWNPNIIWYDGGRFNEWIGRSVHLNMGKRLDQVENCSIKEVNFITFCYVVLPEFIIKNIGLLNESYFMYVEDLDYSYRVWKAGYRLYHVCDAVLYHKVGASNNGEVSEFSAYWGMKNRIKFIFHNLTFTKKVFSVLFIISSRIIKFPIFFFKKQSKVIKAQVRGIIYAFIEKNR